jgi:hypothetical protein
MILRKIKDLLLRRKSNAYFESLSELPFVIWRKIHETGSLELLIRERNANPTRGELVKAWHKINNDYLTRFGLDRKTIRIIEKRKALAIALATYLETGDRRFEMEADLLKAEIEQENSQESKKASFDDLVSQVERFFGFQIDENETTASKFYTYVGQLKQESERIKNKQIKNTLSNG